MRLDCMHVSGLSDGIRTQLFNNIEEESSGPEVPHGPTPCGDDVNQSILNGGLLLVCVNLSKSELMSTREMRRMSVISPGLQGEKAISSTERRSRCFAWFAQRRSSTAHAWQPSVWPRVCPAYTKVARVASLSLLGLLCWGVAYSALGGTAAPGGQLFGLALLSLTAHLAGMLVAVTTLPAVTGMLLAGIAFRNLGIEVIEGGYAHAASLLRKVALVIILTRAGLDLDPGALRRHWLAVLKLGLLPWTAEALVVGALAHWALGLPWAWGFLLGSIVGSVSPTVVVPCLFRLRAKGYGVAKGIPALTVAVASIDDAASVAVYCIISSFMFAEGSVLHEVLQGPVSVLCGVGFGLIWGSLAKFLPSPDDPYAVPLRVLLLLGGGLLAVFGSEVAGFEGAGPVACITAAFVSSCFWSQQGWEIGEHPVADAFEVFMMIFEPILFGITGMRVEFHDLEVSCIYLGLAVLAVGVLARVAVTVAAAVGSGLNWKEKLFVAISWIAKTTVQAALGPAALDTVRRGGAPSTATVTSYGEDLLTVCILSILVTAPLGALLIALTGKRLLSRAAPTPPGAGVHSMRHLQDMLATNMLTAARPNNQAGPV